MPEPGFAFACPRCAAALSNELKCLTCDTVFENRAGIYRFLLPERYAEVLPFLAQYQLVRERDGYHSFTADEYRRLPHIQRGGPQANVWRVRCESYERLIASLDEQPLLILDLGSGNGWLSHCLAKLGHHLVAVDWSDDGNDGLGACQHYRTQYTCVQADFDTLPFITSQFDAVVFNASLHYAPNIEATLCKAYRMLKPEGRIYIMDSPTFYSDESGHIMVSEQLDQLRTNYGIHDAVQPGIGFLTRNEMIELGKVHGITFQFYQSYGAPLWAVKRWWAGIKNHREPAAFGVWIGKPL